MTKTMLKPLIYLALISMFVIQTAKVPHAAPNTAEASPAHMSVQH